MINIRQSKRILGDSWSLLPKDLFIKMLRNQISMMGEDGYALGEDIEEIMSIWCDENCNGLYRLNGHTAYFEEESDMLGFKVYWDGQEEEE